MTSAGDRSNRRRPLPLWKRLLFTTVILCFLAALLECAARLYEAHLQSGWYDRTLRMCERHPNRIWHYKDHFTQSYLSPEFRMELRTNGWRLRDAEVEVPPNAIRVLVIGDSFTFGWGVSEKEVYASRLRALIADRLPARPIHVLNAGHWFYTFDQQLLLAKELVDKYRPDIVVQGLYGPHVSTISSHRWTLQKDGQVAQAFDDGITVLDDGTIRVASRFVRHPLLGSRFLGLAYRTYSRHRAIYDTIDRDLSLFDLEDQRHDDAWKMTATSIQQMGELLSSRSIGYIALGIPRDLQVSDEEWSAEYLAAIGERKIDRELPTRRFAAAARNAGATWVDVLPVFREYYTQDLYYPRDPHWTAKGHDLAARQLLPALLLHLRDRDVALRE
jgi:hypothetical protein